MHTEIAYFGAGCFWNSELIYSKQNGVIETEVGWATFSDHAKGSVEVVKVLYNPERTSYGQLVDVFWETHNPANPINDDDKYVERSVLLYVDEAQKEIADAKLDVRKTEVTTFTKVDKFESYNRAPEKDQKYYFVESK